MKSKNTDAGKQIELSRRFSRSLEFIRERMPSDKVEKMLQEVDTARSFDELTEETKSIVFKIEADKYR